MNKNPYYTQHPYVRVARLPEYTKQGSFVSNEESKVGELKRWVLAAVAEDLGPIPAPTWWLTAV